MNQHIQYECRTKNNKVYEPQKGYYYIIYIFCETEKKNSIFKKSRNLLISNCWFLDLVSVKRLLLLARRVLDCQHNLSCFSVLECVVNCRAHLLVLLNDYSVRSLILWHKFLLIAHFSAHNRNIPDKCTFHLT